MHTQLEQVFYVSRSLASPVDVNRILDVARKRNSERELTGALLFTGGYFAQVLEGNSMQLKTTLRSIAADPRHDQVTLLLDAPLDHRRYPRWGMAFTELQGTEDLIAHLIADGKASRPRIEKLIDLMFADVRTQDLFQEESNSARNS